MAMVDELSKSRRVALEAIDPNSIRAISKGPIKPQDIPPDFELCAVKEKQAKAKKIELCDVMEALHSMKLRVETLEKSNVEKTLETLDLQLQVGELKEKIGAHESEKVEMRRELAELRVQIGEQEREKVEMRKELKGLREEKKQFSVERCWTEMVNQGMTARREEQRYREQRIWEEQMKKLSDKVASLEMRNERKCFWW